MQHDHPVGTGTFLHRIDSRQHRNQTVAVQRLQEQHVVRIDEEIVHPAPVLLPQRAVIELGVDARACVHVGESAQPREPGRVAALAALSQGERPELLKGLRKITLEIACEALALPVTDCITTQLDDLERRKVIHGLHRLCPLKKAAG